MVFDRSFELSLSLKKCPYAQNCGDGEIRACYRDYTRRTIYQKNKIINQRIEAVNIAPISRIEKIAE